MSSITAGSLSIDKKISTAEIKSIQITSQKLTWQETVDNLLDRMNELNGLLIQMHTVLLSLTIDIEKDFAGFKQSEIASDSLKNINKVTAKVLVLVRKSDLFPGVKSTYYEIKKENNYLRELLADRNTGAELEKDGKIQTIMNETLRLAAKKFKK